jgi:hypothetical protein
METPTDEQPHLDIRASAPVGKAASAWIVFCVPAVITVWLECSERLSHTNALPLSASTDRAWTDRYVLDARSAFAPSDAA